MAIIVVISGTSFSQSIPTSGTTETTQIAMPPDSLEIGSLAELRAWAVRQVAGGDIQIWGPAIMWDTKSINYFDFHPEGSTSVDEVLFALHEQMFRVRVTDRTASLTANGNLHNENYMALFSGSAPAIVSPFGKIVCKGIDLNMLVDFVPIYVGEGVQSAYVKTDRGGFNVNVWNGYIFFPKKYAGKNGMLVLWVRGDDGGGREIGYSLTTGKVIPTITITGGTTMKLNDYESFYSKDLAVGETLYVDLCGYLGDGHEAPVASVNIASACTVKFACSIMNTQTKGGSEIFPSSGWLYKKGTDIKTSIPLTPAMWSEGFELDEGEWIFCPKTDIYNSPTEVNSGGGNG